MGWACRTCCERAPSWLKRVACRGWRQQSSRASGNLVSLLQIDHIAQKRSMSSLLTPIHRINFSQDIKDKIKDQCNQYRLTIIHGETGSGKSTQVPQVILDSCKFPNDKPMVIVSQPRRLAAVSIAQRVAKERDSILGEEVGFAIGNHTKCSESTRLLFMTAGSLLERLRSKGEDALSQVRYIVIDEVHERSCENDLLLVCLKQMMLYAQDRKKTSSPAHSVNIVIMSATFNRMKYKQYFSKLRNADATVIPIPALTFGNGATRTRIYLEQAKAIIEKEKLLQPGYFHAVKNNIRQNGSAETSNKIINSKAEDQIPQDMIDLAADLILVFSNGTLTEQQPTLSSTNSYRGLLRIVVFLPTLMQIERMEKTLIRRSQLWQKHVSSSTALNEFSISFLHSSFDVIKICNSLDDECNIYSKKRQILLSTSIAETSLTINGVGLVIDFCKSNIVYWDFKNRRSESKLEWSSQDSMTQRAGRTGRTCHGTVICLAPTSFAESLPESDIPAIQRSSLQDEALISLCSDSKATCNPRTLLRSCLDPPDEDTISDALSCLVTMGAIEQSNGSSSYEPTKYGKLLDALPISLDLGRLVVNSAQMGLTREGCALAAILACTPTPILKDKDDEEGFEQTIKYFIPQFRNNNSDELLEAQLGAVIAYDTYKLNHRVEIGPRYHWMEYLSSNYASDENHELFTNGYLESLDMKGDEIYDETEWCELYGLSMIGLKEIRDCMKTIESMIYNEDYNPYANEWLEHQCLCIQLASSYNEAQGWIGSPSLEQLHIQYIQEDIDGTTKSKRSHFLLSVLGQSRYSNLKELIKLRTTAILPRYEMDQLFANQFKPKMCIHFLADRCRYSSFDCRNCHDPQRKNEQVLCSAFNSLKGCQFGAHCHNLHIHSSSLDYRNNNENDIDKLKIVAIHEASYHYHHQHRHQIASRSSNMNSNHDESSVLILTNVGELSHDDENETVLRMCWKSLYELEETSSSSSSSKHLVFNKVIFEFPNTSFDQQIENDLNQEQKKICAICLLPIKLTQSTITSCKIHHSHLKCVVDFQFYGQSSSSSPLCPICSSSQNTSLDIDKDDYMKRNRIMIFKIFRSFAIFVAKGRLLPQVEIHLKLRARQFAHWNVNEIANMNFFEVSSCSINETIEETVGAADLINTNKTSASSNTLQYTFRMNISSSQSPDHGFCSIYQRFMHKWCQNE